MQVDSLLGSCEVRRKAEVAAMIRILRKRTTRNVPLGVFCLFFALFFLAMTYGYTTTIEYRNFIPVDGLVTLALALCSIYAASLCLIVRTSDKVLKHVMEEMFSDDGEAIFPKKLNGVKAALPKKQVEQERV
jgi:hypothetical protein